MIALDIISDPICPWCWIGWTNLARAMEARPDHPFVLEWHPFQLNPDMPREGMDRREYLELKFGGREGAVRAYRPVVDHAAAAGLDLKLDRIARTPSTLDAHRLIHWAGIEGRQTPVAVALFRAYFDEGRDIGDRDVLRGIAEDAGLDGAMIAQLLQGDADVEEIRARDAHTRSRGVQGVPCFVVAKKHVVTGAQPTDLWLQVIDEVREAEAGPGPDAGPLQ
jgi:predicted DsbA family dithiol-disulfide isomerase